MRIRDVTWGATFASAILLPTAVVEAQHANEPELTLVWRDHHELLRDFDRARSEADDIFGRLGVSVSWESVLDPAPQDEVATSNALRIQVVLMPSEPSGWKLPRNAMGVVLLPSRSPQKTVFVFFPAVLRSVGLGSKQGLLLEPAEGKVVARAIGRVVVHEVVHAVAPAVAHADSGLMNQALSARALLQNRLTVDERTKRAFLKGVTRPDRGRRASAPRPE